MSSLDKNSKDLVEKAERGQWNLECDEKVLESMQNVAGVRKLFNFERNFHLI